MEVRDSRGPYSTRGVRTLVAGPYSTRGVRTLVAGPYSTRGVRTPLAGVRTLVAGVRTLVAGVPTLVAPSTAHSRGSIRRYAAPAVLSVTGSLRRSRLIRWAKGVVEWAVGLREASFLPAGRLRRRRTLCAASGLAVDRG